jgi:hypothetical protein
VLLAKEYRIETLPTIAFVSPQGRLLYRVNGVQAGPQFAQVIDHAQKKAADVFAWRRLSSRTRTTSSGRPSSAGHVFDVEF